MSCKLCKDIEDRSDVPHLVRICEGCGREVRFVRHGKHGKGLKVEHGERLVIPKDWLKISANPLKGRGRLYRPGLRWYAELIFVDALPSKESEYQDEARALEQRMDEIVNSSPLISGLDVNKEQDVEQIFEILGKNRGTREFWALMTGMFLAEARRARDEGNFERDVWATACAERCRSMVVFAEHLEDVVWMGHSAGRLIDIMKIWDARRTEGSESFWQETFKGHPFVLSQVFAVPVVFIRDNAYIGGMKIDRREAKFVDYLFSAESSREAILVELKTPVTKLLGREYRRNIFATSAELSGAVVQLLSYRTELINSLGEVVSSGVQIQAFRPKCVLIAGDAARELTDEHRRASFESYRAAIDVEIVTYDELFRKLEILAKLFSLKRADPEDDDSTRSGSANQ